MEPRLSIFFNRLSRAWAVEPNMLSPEERISYLEYYSGPESQAVTDENNNFPSNLNFG